MRNLKWTIESTCLSQQWPSLLFGLYAQFVHNFAHNLSTWLYLSSAKQGKEIVLWDLGFAVAHRLGLDETARLRRVWAEASERCSAALVLWLLLVCLLPLLSYRKGLVAGFRRQRLTVRHSAVLRLRRVLVALGVLLLMRSALFLVVRMPAPAAHCHTPVEDLGSWYQTLFRIDPTGGCGDLLFSSHQTFALVAVLATREFVLVKKLWIGVALVAASQAVLIVLAHNHYSVDVLLACFLCPLVWHRLSRPPTVQLLQDDWGLDYRQLAPLSFSFI